MSKSAIFEVLCVGLPFALFKIIMGQLLGWPLVALGLVDFLINLINLITLLFLRQRRLKHCFFSYLVGIVLSFLPPINHQGPKDMGVAIDTLISFCIVAVMIASGLMKELNQWQIILWNGSVILNISYAGVARVVEASRRFSV